MTRTEDRTPPPMPRWVKISGLVLGLCVLAIVAALLLGGNGDGHGPGRHDGLQVTGAGW